MRLASAARKAHVKHAELALGWLSESSADPRRRPARRQPLETVVSFGSPAWKLTGCPSEAGAQCSAK